jgi:cytosine/adenosine deaminase-related metal-dependent hydrolase
MKSLKSGVTFILDHHSSPFAIEGSMETIAGAFEFLGVSHLLCYEISDRDGLQKGLEGFSYTDQYLKQAKGLVGLQASFTASDHTMRRAATLLEKYDTGVHIHVAEAKYDQQHCHENYKKTVVDRLNNFGFLQSSKSVLVHCLQISDHEHELLSDSKAWIAQTAESNIRNNLGCINPTGLEDRIMLGTDGMHNDLIQSARCSLYTGKDQPCGDKSVIYSRLRNANRYLNQNAFKGDGDNNLIIVDNNLPLNLNSGNFCDNFLDLFSTQNIEHVISKGELVVRNRNLINMNENDILDFIREMGKKLTKSFN